MGARDESLAASAAASIAQRSGDADTEIATLCLRNASGNLSSRPLRLAEYSEHCRGQGRLGQQSCRPVFRESGLCCDMVRQRASKARNEQRRADRHHQRL
jgi:hypothetical protein